MKLINRFIIVTNGRKSWRILDLALSEFVGGIYDYKPVEECRALNETARAEAK